MFHSLTTALRWSEGIDRIVVFCIGEKPADWSFRDPRIEVREAPRLAGDYFLGNKSYPCDLEAERVLYLDCDTLVVGPLERLWSDWRCDFRARPANANFGPRWKHEVWLSTFRTLGTRPIPMFNSGVLLFQNRAHQRVRSEWRAKLHDYLEGRLEEPLIADRHMMEQCALALAISAADLEIAIMGPREHTFGWLDEPFADSVVLHTSGGDGHFERYCMKLGVTVASTLLVPRSTNDAISR